MGLNLLGILKFQFPNGPDLKIIEDNKKKEVKNPIIQASLLLKISPEDKLT